MCIIYAQTYYYALIAHKKVSLVYFSGYNRPDHPKVGVNWHFKSICS